ncbi:integral membrane protein-like protein [Trematosphaeria pertusa]|uniref:Integral membrane protein-like protein n=1 Tax=Trematosphaeria pertusa TaxID=390896 RepID=A0A6A6J4E2_9PLEO|nr:integral membrane protein-like protein [Trematosphaeria pertusa]KAF2257237.1 integral membrane protein-like protein [Trematosphaeria pertusa]
MATPEAQESAAKERIIKHMNADHSDSVRRYLEAFQKKSFYQVRHAKMTDITVNVMKFDCGGEQVTIPFDPPMKSLREARERVVQLDKDALQALGRSDISITKYIPPYVHPLHLFNFSQCFIVYVVFSRASNFSAGSILYDSVLFHFPGFANFCLAIQPYLISIMVGIHVYETVLMVRKLARHGLTPFERLWWAWTGSCFVEGVTSFKRLDALIAEKRREKEAKKH